MINEYSMNRRQGTEMTSFGASTSNVGKAQGATLILLVAWLYAYHDTLKSLFATYQHFSYDWHGFFVFPITLLLLFGKIPELRNTIPQSSQTGLVLLSLLAMTWVYAMVSKNILLQQGMVLGMLPILILIANGLSVLKILIFPITFMVLFAVPYGYLLTPEVQTIFFEGLLNALVKIGLPIEVQEMNVRVRFGIFKFDSGTVGLKGWVGYCAVGMLCAYGVASTFIQRIAVVMGFALFPLIAHALIVGGLICLNVWLQGNALRNSEVAFYSVVSSVVGLIAAVGWAWCIKRQRGESSFLQGGWGRHGVDYTQFRWFKPTAIACGVVLSMPWLADNLTNNPWKSAGTIMYQAPVLSAWKGPFETGTLGWKPDFRGSAASLLMEYRQGLKSVYLYSNYFDNPKSTRGVLDPDNKLYDDSRWKVLKQSRYGVALTPLLKKEIKELIVVDNAEKRLIWYWYYLGSMETANVYFMSFLERIQGLNQLSSESGVIAISTEINENDVEMGRERLLWFLKALVLQNKQLMHPPRRLN